MGTREEVEERALPFRPGDEVLVEIVEPHMYDEDDAVAKIDGYIISIAGAAGSVGEKRMVRIDQVGRTAATALLLDEAGEVVTAPARPSRPAPDPVARVARRRPPSAPPRRPPRWPPSPSSVPPPATRTTSRSSRPSANGDGAKDGLQSKPGVAAAEADGAVRLLRRRPRATSSLGTSRLGAAAHASQQHHHQPCTRSSRPAASSTA